MVRGSSRFQAEKLSANRIPARNVTLCIGNGACPMQVAFEVLKHRLSSLEIIILIRQERNHAN